MKFYLLDDPAKPAEFARFSHVGTWSEGGLCPQCGASAQKLVEPLQIEWDRGTDRIGSFSWGGYHSVVTDEVRSYLERNHAECTFGRVEIMRPTKKTKRLRVPFPYTGPRLHWIIPTKRIPILEGRSGVCLVSECPECGDRAFKFKREGLYVETSQAGTVSMFLIQQFGRSRATFVTERLLDGVKNQGFTNLCPRAAGEIVEFDE